VNTGLTSSGGATVELNFSSDAVAAPKIAQVWEYRAIAENPYYLSGTGAPGDVSPWTVMFKWIDGFGYVREEKVQTFATMALAAQVMRGLSNHRLAVFRPDPREALAQLEARDVGRDVLTGDTRGPKGLAARRAFLRRQAERKAGKK
jgi:hypothetical protein